MIIPNSIVLTFNPTNLIRKNDSRRKNTSR